MAKKSPPSILVWGRSDRFYSRNQILIQTLEGFGCQVRFFSPQFSVCGDLEAFFTRGALPDLVWVPCFRQRDILAAARYCRRNQLPLLVDPLISAYDKQIFEKGKIRPDSLRAKRLLAWEQKLLGKADLVLVDTQAHAEFFHQVLSVPREKIVVVPVGAEEGLFVPQPWPEAGAEAIPEVLFFGSFIPLQGPQVIVEAARVYQGPPVRWRMIGAGPLLEECRAMAAGLPSFSLESWVPYADLPERIGRAAILLGIFGVTPKALRVIPNKVYQAAACGRPLITLDSTAYPPDLRRKADSGFSWVPPGNPVELAAAVARLAGRPDRLQSAGAAARASYEEWLGHDKVQSQLELALHRLGLMNEERGKGVDSPRRILKTGL